MAHLGLEFGSLMSNVHSWSLLDGFLACLGGVALLPANPVASALPPCWCDAPLTGFSRCNSRLGVSLSYACVGIKFIAQKSWWSRVLKVEFSYCYI